MKCLARVTILSLGLTTVLTLAVAERPDIRRVDFRNFSFPWDEDMADASSVPPISRWISPTPMSRIRAKDGMHHFYPSGGDRLEREHAPLVSVDSVTYGDLDGDGKEEAAVHLNYSTGGTANWDFLYVYALSHGRLRLLGILESGSRGYGGLVRAAISQGLLVLDFADEERRVGDCCSEGYIRVRYRWQQGGFVETGTRERGDLDLKTK